MDANEAVASIAYRAARTTGFAPLSSGSAQEAQDLAAIGHAATLSARTPVLHCSDERCSNSDSARDVRLPDEEARRV